MLEFSELIGDGPGTCLADVVGAEVERLEVGEVFGDGPSTGIAEIHMLQGKSAKTCACDDRHEVVP